MSKTAKVMEIERELVNALQDSPYHKLLVMQMAAIARTAIQDAKASWKRHDKTPSHEQIPDMFVRG
jgi:hypothetical protein